jgi:hypothetical protein
MRDISRLRLIRVLPGVAPGAGPGFGA